MEIKRAKELGLAGRALYYWDLCPNCQAGRWRQARNKGKLCPSCATSKRIMGSGNPRWNNGRRIDPKGYIYIAVTPEYPFFGMASISGKGYCIAEHRLVMAQSLGRILQPWEVVHHINGIKGDNRLENLELLSGKGIHSSFSLLERRVKVLEDKLVFIEAENVLLRSFLEEIRDSIPENTRVYDAIIRRASFNEGEGIVQPS